MYMTGERRGSEFWRGKHQVVLSLKTDLGGVHNNYTPNGLCILMEKGKEGAVLVYRGKGWECDGEDRGQVTY